MLDRGRNETSSAIRVSVAERLRATGFALLPRAPAHRYRTGQPAVFPGVIVGMITALVAAPTVGYIFGIAMGVVVATWTWKSAALTATAMLVVSRGGDERARWLGLCAGAAKVAVPSLLILGVFRMLIDP